ncbi:hypothetical protein ISS03_00670 [Patescibacteria group bacterium]|nr:hypothetical protein [Patescibacteria group bacterium]
MNRDTDLVISKIKELANQGQGKAAEQLIIKFASEHGDRATEPIVRALNIVEQANILRSHDFTTASILTDLLSPIDIAKALETEPVNWEAKLLECPERLQENALNTLAHFVLSCNNKQRQMEIIKAILANEGARSFLKFTFIGWTPLELKKSIEINIYDDTGTECAHTESTNIDIDMASALLEHGSIEILFLAISEVAPKMAQSLVKHNNGISEASLSRMVFALTKHAQKMIGVEQSTICDEDMFVPLAP